MLASDAEDRLDGPSSIAGVVALRELRDMVGRTTRAVLSNIQYWIFPASIPARCSPGSEHNRRGTQQRDNLV